MRLDLHNIKCHNNINCIQKDQNEANCVLYWVAEMGREEHIPVLCFKRQGEGPDYTVIERYDFLPGIQTDFQQDMFIKYAQKLVCVLPT